MPWDLGFIEVLGLSLWLGNRVRVSVLGLGIRFRYLV
jgi:hypothetical protein